MIKRLKELQANKGQFANGGELSNCLKTDKGLRREVEILSTTFLHKSVQGCSSCYMDAYLQLINLNIEKMEEQIKAKFRLRAGATLRDINGDSSKLMSNHNITDKLALYHLKTRPSCQELFDVLPNDWEELVEKFELSKEELSIDTRRKTDAKAKLDLATQTIESLTKEVETLTEQNKELQRAAQIGVALMQDNVEEFVGLLTRVELEEFISTQELELEITEAMSDDEVRTALLSAMDDEDEHTSSDEQKQAENDLVLQISERIKAGETKTAIKESLKDGKVGKKNLTQRFIAELIARADELNK